MPFNCSVYILYSTKKQCVNNMDKKIYRGFPRLLYEQVFYKLGVFGNEFESEFGFFTH